MRDKRRDQGVYMTDRVKGPCFFFYINWVLFKHQKKRKGRGVFLVTGEEAERGEK